MISHLEQDLESNPQWDGSMRDLMISVSMTPLQMIENYTREVYDNTGELLYDTMSSASVIFRIKPYIGVTYTF